MGVGSSIDGLAAWSDQEGIAFNAKAFPPTKPAVTGALAHRSTGNQTARLTRRRHAPFCQRPIGCAVADAC
jgi:hypothetical protein